MRITIDKKHSRYLEIIKFFSEEKTNYKEIVEDLIEKLFKEEEPKIPKSIRY